MSSEKLPVPLRHTRPVTPWNKGLYISVKPPLKLKQFWSIRFHLQRERRVRNLALLDLAVDSARDGHLSTRRYAWLVGEWVGATGLSAAAYGTHSLRRTKVAMIYNRTGKLRTVKILLGHTGFESKVR